MSRSSSSSFSIASKSFVIARSSSAFSSYPLASNLAYYVIRKIAEVESIKRKELDEEKVGEVIAKVNQHIVDLRRNVDSINRIEEIAGNLQTTCNKKLEELINFSTTLKKNMSEEVNEILSELEKI